MAQVHLPGIGRDYVWDTGNDTTVAVPAPDDIATPMFVHVKDADGTDTALPVVDDKGNQLSQHTHLVHVGTPWLQIYSGGHDAFANAPWVEKALGGKGSVVVSTFTIEVWKGQRDDYFDCVLALQCKGPNGVRWEIVIDVNGAVVGDWKQGPGYWQLP